MLVLRIYLILLLLPVATINAQSKKEVVAYERKGVNESPFGRVYYHNTLTINKQDSTFILESLGYNSKDERKKKTKPVNEDTTTGKWFQRSDTLNLLVEKP